MKLLVIPAEGLAMGAVQMALHHAAGLHRKGRCGGIRAPSWN